MLKLTAIEFFWSVEPRLQQFKGKIKKNKAPPFLSSLWSRALYNLSKLVKRANPFTSSFGAILQKYLERIRYVEKYEKITFLNGSQIDVNLCNTRRFNGRCSNSSSRRRA